MTRIATAHYYSDTFSKIYQDSPTKYTVTMGMSQRILGAIFDDLQGNL